MIRRTPTEKARDIIPLRASFTLQPQPDPYLPAHRLPLVEHGEVLYDTRFTRRRKLNVDFWCPACRAAWARVDCLDGPEDGYIYERYCHTHGNGSLIGIHGADYILPPSFLRREFLIAYATGDKYRNITLPLYQPGATPCP